MRERVKWLDTVKGVAIILVVIGHVCGSLYNSGLHELPVINSIKIFVNSFHMQLFFMISGYVFIYSYCDVTDRNIVIEKERINRQIVNLSLLYVIYEIVRYIISNAFKSEVNIEVKPNRILMLPYKAIQEYWYIYVLVIIYLMMYFITSINVVHAMIVTFFFGLFYAIADFISAVGFKEWTALKAGYYIFFFCLGGLIYCAQKKKKTLLFRMTEMIGSVLGLLYVLYIDNTNPIANFFVSIVIADFVFELFYNFKLENPFFSFIGENSLHIYLLHVYFTSGGRLVLKFINSGNVIFDSVFLLVFGIVGPITIARIIRRTILYSIVFKPIALIERMK